MATSKSKPHSIGLIGVEFGLYQSGKIRFGILLFNELKTPLLIACAQ